MIQKLQKTFALTQRGARDLVKATLWSALANLSLMFPVGLLILVLEQLTKALETGGGFTRGIWPYTGLALALVALIFVIHFIQYKSLYIATYIESANRRIGLAEKLRRLPLSFFGRRDLSDLTATLMSDCSALEQVFSHQVPQLFGSCISTAIIGIGLLAMDWRLGIAALWVLPAALLMTLGSRKLQDKMGTVSLEARRAATDGLQECLETIKDIKSCNQKERYLEGLREKIAGVERAAIRSELTTGVLITSAQGVLRLGIPTVVLTGALLFAGGQVDFITYLVFLLAVTRLYDPLSIVLTQIAALFNAGIKIRRMQAIENEQVQRGSEDYAPDNYDIVFDQVKFAYQENEGVLEDVSFTARQGEVTALVGPSGGGKSTAAKLAARFWDVNGGRITLGGRDVSSVEPETLLKSFAIVFQDVVLFHDTILENIRLGRRTATDEEVLAAARAAQCDEFVRQMPEGYQTVIGENGSTLSGGERQRISIARAILKDAPVILLDEATASLDVENESKVQRALSGLIRNKTVLIIAHRMRTVAGADRVVVLEGGRVAQQGTPRQLLAEDGPYRRMVQLQNESLNWSLKGG